jgi:curved DNA-binding protein CbpA
MDDPYLVLGLPSDSDDETIRRRYLELVKQYPPANDPEKFKSIRDAYDRLRDLPTRLRYRLFEHADEKNFDKLFKDLSCLSPRRRVSLKTLLTLARKPT